MNTQAAKSFAEWLAHDQPELFVAIYKRAIPRNVQQGLSGFTDILSSIGTGLSTAVSSVGSYLASPEGAATIGALGGAYLQSQAAKKAVATNYSRAQSGVGAAPIQTVYNPTTQQYEAVVMQSNGQAVPLTPNVQRALAPGLPAWVPWSLGGAGLLLLAVLLLKR